MLGELFQLVLLHARIEFLRARALGGPGRLAALLAGGRPPPRQRLRRG